MNLAILIGRFPPGVFGGAEIQAEAWAARLGDRHDVTVVTRLDPPGQRPVQTHDGYRVLRLEPSGVPLWRTVRDLAKIHATIDKLEPRPDLLLCFQTFISGLAGVRIQRSLGIPAVVWVRGEGEYRLANGSLSRWVSPLVWGSARGVLVQSEEVRRELLDELGRRSTGARTRIAAKLEVVPNGIELPDLAPGPAPRGERLLAVGRLIEDKGMDVVIDAVQGLFVPLTIAGDGPERERLESRARANGLDARFEGFLDRDRLDLLYREAAAVVLASRRGEGLPNVVLEAMAHGRPVVTTAIAGMRELIEDGVNGLLVPADDPDALRAALARVIDDHDLAQRLGRAARVTAERHSWAGVVPRLEAALARWSAR